MRVTATRPVYVETHDGKTLLKQGESAEVDGRTYSDSHMFVSAGYLVAESREEKPKRGRKPKDEQTETEITEQAGSAEE